MSEQVTKEQVEQARSADLIDYFRSNGYNLESKGGRTYVKEIKSLCVHEQTGAWYYHYSSEGGNNSVNCLTQVLGKDFMTAVRELAGQSYAPKYTKTERAVTVKTPEPKVLTMPERATHMKNVFAYMIKSREISADIVSQLAHEQLLYQDKRGNAVFVHKDRGGEAVGGEIHGTNTQKRFKGVAAGTGNSVFKFAVGEPTTRAYVFESAIDMLSFYTMSDKEKLGGAVFVSMAGLKPKPIVEMQNSGIRIYSCVDNDEASKKFCNDNGFKNLSGVLAERGVKDWNELLVAVRAGQQKPLTEKPEQRERFVETDLQTAREPHNFLSDSREKTREYFSAEQTRTDEKISAARNERTKKF